MRPMTADIPDLARLRQEIDALDDRIQDALIERAGALARIAAVKRAEAAMFIRPAREAQILRRLIGRHRGDLPPLALARIWRELISALYSLQGQIHVAVHAPEKSAAYWDLARSHFGTLTPVSLQHSAADVLALVGSQKGAIGVLPVPGDQDRWWTHLASDARATPRVIGRLPFVVDLARPGEDVSAFVIARLLPEPSGEDVTLISITIADAPSRDRLAEMVRKAGLDARIIAASAGAGQQYLLAAAGYIESNARELAALRQEGGASIEAVPIGAYPVPVVVGPHRPDRA
jgi:chorismate mutase-like protein